MRPFRFGVTMLASASRQRWVGQCREAEDLGYDVISVADHLKYVAPFPAMMLAAAATERVRVGTFVLNTAFYNPTLLARDVAGTDEFTGGRLELGLGAGYVKAEFDAAGLEFPRPGARIDHLERTIEVLKPGPPLLIGGSGDRLLTLAAKHADIIGFPGAGFSDGRMYVFDADDVAERVEFTRAALGPRVDEVEFNTLLQIVGAAPDPADPLVRNLAPERIADAPAVLIGTPREMADQLLARRERYGFSYVSVLEQNIVNLAPVIELLR
jgi:probable F420-dependent oxidoreductase